MRNILLFLFIAIFSYSSAQQLSIPRVDEMPDFPQPYNMRDWNVVSRNYDSIIFDLDANGQFLPLASIFDNTTNYPDQSALAIQSYIGTKSSPGKEAINIIPAVVGASLAGIDKSDQNGINWPLYCQEYFNRRPSENVYLNGPVTSSGHDWWYETMPNIFFYQLNYFYPNIGDFDYQVTTIADRWLRAVEAMGGSTTPWDEPFMNYRAFKLSTMTPLESGVKQPEAAGAIASTLYQAFSITGDAKYRIGAEQAIEFLNDWESNPSYEIQLPYGVYAAARMNAELGTTYDIEKMMNWCFDRGPLRGWGVITGNWGGIDMDGLIGEVNASAPDYVFHMNSLEHVGALVPAVRYDDRFATSIAKWVLNAANASRFYYSGFLPDDMQDNEEWTSEYDPESAIAYESLREKDEGPFGTGDAMNGGWAETNLGLYGSSHVGIFGGIIEKTNVEGILQLNLLATDYYLNDAYPTSLYYNPHDETKQVQLDFQDAVFDIYDAISNQVILKNATDIAQLDIPAKSSVMTVILPFNSEIGLDLNRAYVDGVIIDYNAGQNVENYPPRIKALAVEDTIIVATKTTTFYCTAEDRETSQLEYLWSIDDQPFEGDETLVWHAPSDTGFYTIVSKVVDEGDLSDLATITVKVVEKINYPPEIIQLTAENRILPPSGSTEIVCLASDPNDDEMFYSWSASSGSVSGEGNAIVFEAPDENADVYVVCEVTDTEGAGTKDSLLLLVRDPDQGQSGDLVAHYEFDGNANDITGNGHDGSITNCSFTNDMHGGSNRAIYFDQSNSMVSVTNGDALNFKDGLTVSYLMKINQFFEHESYPVSHGNWTTRWKTSLTDEHLRFTVNGSDGIIDVDSETIFEVDNWYHIVALFNGMDCLVYVNGELDGYKPFSGKINSTAYDFIFGQSLPDQSGFNFNGMLDKVRIYNYGLSHEDVKQIFNDDISSIFNQTSSFQGFKVFPNPAADEVQIFAKTDASQDVEIIISSITGKVIFQRKINSDRDGKINEKMNIEQLPPGSFLITIKDNNSIATRLLVHQ